MAKHLLLLKLAIVALAPFASAGNRILTHTDNIGQTVREQRANKNASFSIQANADDGTTVSFNVKEATNPAVTPATTVKVDGDESPIGDRVLHTLLVSDDSSAFALLAVDPLTDDTQGIVQVKGKKPYKVSQSKGDNGGKAKAEEDTNAAPPAWSCGVSHGNPFGRKLHEDEHEVHDIEHDNHEHDNHLEHIENAVESLSSQLRGVKVNPLNKPRRLQDSGYNYQVDMYIEIDNDFITLSGGSMATAVNYVNSLITAANVVYEEEIDTHLNVAVIALSTLYDSAKWTDTALKTMRATYGGSQWHTSGIDLHHGLFGKDMGGGIAYVGVLCNSFYGFGLSASLSGNFVSLDRRLVWDAYVFMHEIGHNFNSDHTHDYSPKVDTCGSRCPRDGGATQWSTIMSYCHQCTGSYGNIMYTFGGLYTGSGSRSSLTNWIDNPELVANYNAEQFSTEPRRVSNTMYNHASTRGSCLSVTTPTPQPTGPTKAPVSQSPTATPACGDITVFSQCSSAPNCEWVRVKGQNYECKDTSTPGTPTTPSPTPPTANCVVYPATCPDPQNHNCCNGCYANGKWAGFCK
jgi:hypothetical protein